MTLLSVTNRALSRSWGRWSKGILTGAAIALMESANGETYLGPALTLWVENDAVFQTDRHYTHGSRMGYLHQESAADSASIISLMARWLPAFGMESVSIRWGAQLGQSLYTPTDLYDPAAQLRDRPYAAWLYGAATIQRRGASLGSVPTLDVVSLDVGLVGPGALGDELQSVVHRVDAAGWDHQLRNEPAINLETARIWRGSIGTPDDWSFQWLPSCSLRTGTLQVKASVGCQLRVGHRIPEDFGRYSLDESAPETGGIPQGVTRGFYTYFLLGFEGKAVACNMLLDGNLWHNSHSVDKKPFIADVTAGWVVGWRKLELAYIHVFRSQEFRGQPEVDSFGSVAISYRW